MKKEMLQLEDGSKLFYRRYGSGSRTLVLFHGLFGSSELGESWQQAIQKANATGYVAERPGYGESDEILLTSVAQWMPIFRQLAKHLQLEQAELVGMSAGAPYAYASALACPERICKVWALGGVPAVYREEVLAHYHPRSQHSYEQFYGSPLDTIQDYYVNLLNAMLINPPENPQTVRIIQECLARRCYGMAQESKLQIRPWDLMLDELQTPVALWHAVQDDMVPYAGAEEMTRVLPHAVLHTAPDAALEGVPDPHSKSIDQGFRWVLAQSAEKQI